MVAHDSRCDAQRSADAREVSLLLLQLVHPLVEVFRFVVDETNGTVARAVAEQLDLQVINLLLDAGGGCTLRLDEADERGVIH